MPYAYQCCVYGSCDSYKPAGQWDTEQGNSDDDLHKRTVVMYPVHADTHCKKTRNHSVFAITSNRGKFEPYKSVDIVELFTHAHWKNVRVRLKLPGS